MMIPAIGQIGFDTPFLRNATGKILLFELHTSQTQSRIKRKRKRKRRGFASANRRAVLTKHA